MITRDNDPRQPVPTMAAPPRKPQTPDRRFARIPGLAFLLGGWLCGVPEAGELRFAGTLGNSAESEVLFAGKSAGGMGPVVDDEATIWERGGSRRLNRYALDGRLLAHFDIPESGQKADQLVQAGSRLVLRLGRADLYTLARDAAPGAKPQRLNVSADVMSSNAVAGRVVLFDKATGELSWFDPETEARIPIVKPEGEVTGLHLAPEDGTVFAFGGTDVRAWKDGQPVPGFPKPFRGGRPQKIGRHWFSHTGHGTINRLNDQFEPEPGVVLGGASGSFIGYLPQSAELITGRGLARVRDDVYAVSGATGVVQLLTWNAGEQRFMVSRRIGALVDLPNLAIDAAGTVWTPRGSWRWADTAEAAVTLGDSEPAFSTQPVVLGGQTLCLLKKHPRFVFLARGPLINANGWSRLETQTVPDFDLAASVTGAAAVPVNGRFRLITVRRDGTAASLGISGDGRLAGKPMPIVLPGLTECTSLAWLDGCLLAAGRGRLFGYEPVEADGWKNVDVRTDFGNGELFIHSDGKRLAISDAASGEVRLLDSRQSELARYGGLDSPGPVALAGDRIVVYETGRQRLVRLEYATAPRPPLSLRASPLPAAIPDGSITVHEEADFQELTRPAGLSLSLAITSHPERGTTLSIRTFPGAEVQVGIANVRSAWTLTREQARTTAGQIAFLLPAGDWSQLRLALTVAAQGQRERFGFLDGRAIHAPFDPNPATWAEFELDSYRERVRARHQEIRIRFDQPMDGKASLVIEDAAGRRVRNLLSGQSFAAGWQTVVWDGLDENGALVAPGTYRWRGLAHSGIEPVYRMSFANGDEPTTAPWGPNHSTLHQATSNGKLVFFAAPVTEGGWALLALDAAGRFVQGYEHQHGFGIGHDAIAADDRYLYCAQDGFAWGGTKDVDLKRPDWQAVWTITVVRYEIASGRMVEFSGKRRAIEVDRMAVGPGAGHPDLKQFNLGGLAVLDGRLYVGVRNRQAVLVYDTEHGEPVATIPLAAVRHLAAGPDAVFAATDREIVRLGDPRFHIPAGDLSISGLTVGGDGAIWVSDAASHQIHRFTADGQPAGVIGRPGGPYSGAYVPERMVRPAGLAFGPDGRLWVTERRWNPKRVLAWDLTTDSVVVEKFGMPRYGGDGSGFDPEDGQRWIGLGCFWHVNIAERTARPTHILSVDGGHIGGYAPHGYQFFREAGRTFVSARGKIALISEVMPDGTLRDLVATAGTHHFAYACGWAPPQAYIDAFYARWPAKRAGEKGGRKGEGKPWAQRGMGVLWVDRSGDGKPQADEFDFCGDQLDYAGGSWGHLQHSLSLAMPVADKTGVRIVTIAPHGFLANGTPDYPPLDEAIANSATPVPLTPGYKRSGVATVRDRQGRFLFNSDPEMSAFSPAGAPLWTFPNRWSDVHGSHHAPLPEPGVMQGTLAFLGRAPLDDSGDVVFLNGNHGRCFLLTTDGLYLDEAFADVRVSYLKNEYRLGGEIFGGSFGRDERSGRYFVQVGHGPYRIYELTGLDRIRRSGGPLEVSADQVAAAEQRRRRQVTTEHQAKTATIPGTLKWTRDGRFPVELKLEADTARLRLHYRVQDSSPWVNNGRDWTTLFATGDSVDFQFATDPAANPQRRGPAVGDKRLVIAPFAGTPVAVLYEHRKPGGQNPIEFTSPWRGEKVDHVEQLAGVRIEVKAADGSYEVKATIPLQAIGLRLVPGERFRADFGVTYGDAGGTDTNLRSYWSNPSTALVDDIPGEIMLTPELWGELEVRSPTTR